MSLSDIAPTDGRAPVQASATWDATAADYEALAEPFTRQFAQAALEIADLRPGERVLDVAAGTGALSILAAEAGAYVLATDFSPGMVARVAARLSGALAGSGEARVMDGQALELPDASFDAAFSIFGLMLFPDWARGLSELARVVGGGGRCVLAVWCSPEGAGPTPALLQALRAVVPDRPIPPFPPGMLILSDAGAMRRAMEDVGLHAVEVLTVSGTWTAPSADWLADNADRLFRQMPAYASLSADERSSVRERLRVQLRSEHGAGEVRLTSDAHIAMGRRR